MDQHKYGLSSLCSSWFWLLCGVCMARLPTIQMISQLDDASTNQIFVIVQRRSIFRHELNFLWVIFNGEHKVRPTVPIGRNRKADRHIDLSYKMDCSNFDCSNQLKRHVPARCCKGASASRRANMIFTAPKCNHVSKLYVCVFCGNSSYSICMLW